MERELLEKIAVNTEPKESFQIIISDNKTRFTTQFNPHIQFKENKGYEIALVNLETYYSFPNIDESNNHFKYSPDSGHTWLDFRIPEGSYDIDDINDVIQQQLKDENHTGGITLSANINTLKAILILKPGFGIDFRYGHSLSSVLGFNRVVYDSPYQESENPVNILNINSVLVNIDIISGSYVNGQRNPTIYSFFPHVSPGHKIIETPSNLVYLPITLKAIYSIETIITDQNGHQLNLRGENITMRFHIREI